MIAMLLAGGQGSRLGVLTADVAKPAVSFGGKYRNQLRFSVLATASIQALIQWVYLHSISHSDLTATSE